MLKEGKIWNLMAYEYISGFDFETGEGYEERKSYPVVAALHSDTLINGNRYLKLYYTGDEEKYYHSAWREEDRKVYTVRKGGTEEILVFDFGMEINAISRFESAEELQLTKTDVVNVNGELFFRQSFTSTIDYGIKDETPDVIAVEGVGSNSYGIFSCGLFADLVGGIKEDDPSYYESSTLVFLSCEEDGEVIFTKDDFDKEAYVEPEPIAGYRPMLKEGKAWNYKNYIDGRPEEYNYEYSYTLQGDTIVGGKSCLKLYLDSEQNGHAPTYTAAMYEEDGKVFYFPQGQEKAELLYDFTKGVGETIWEKNGEYYKSILKVGKKDVVSVNGQEFRRFEISHSWNGDSPEASTLWVEGIGSNMDMFNIEPLPGNYNQLVSCYEDGQPIFAVNDFSKTATSELPEGYHGFIKEGKTWNVMVNRRKVTYRVDKDGNELIDEETGKPKKFVEETTFPGKYVMKGSRVVDGHTCMDMYSYSDVDGESYCCSWYEDGQKVYQQLTGIGLDLLYDFGLNKGGTLPLAEDCELVTVDKVNAFGNKFARFEFNYTDSERKAFSYVEGVGGIYVVYGYLQRPLPTLVGAKISEDIPDGYTEIDVYWESGDYEEFLSCEEDGEVIFTNEDFVKPGDTDGIAPIASPVVRSKGNGKTYDLLGREVTTPQPGRIYIRDGRKFMAK